MSTINQPPRPPPAAPDGALGIGTGETRLIGAGNPGHPAVGRLWPTTKPIRMSITTTVNHE